MMCCLTPTSSAWKIEAKHQGGGDQVPQSGLPVFHARYAQVPPRQWAAMSCSASAHTLPLEALMQVASDAKDLPRDLDRYENAS